MRDVNDTGFDLVLGEGDWTSWTGVRRAAADAEASVVYDRSRRALTLRPRTEDLRVGGRRRRSGPVLGEEDRAPAAPDRYGNWYWIDPDDRSRILVRSVGDGNVTTFWSGADRSSDPRMSSSAAVSDSPFRARSAQTGETGVGEEGIGEEGPGGEGDGTRLGGLTVTGDHRLVVGGTAAEEAVREGASTSAPARSERPRAELLVFDLHGGGPPRSIPLRADGFDPIDAAPRPDGGLYLLDRYAPSGDGPGRIWAFDRALRVTGPRRSGDGKAAFRPRPVPEDADADSPPEEVDRADERRHGGEAGPFRLPPDHGPGTARSVVSLPDGTVLVLYGGRVVSDDGERVVSSAVRYDLLPEAAGADPLTVRGRVAISELLTEAGIEQSETARSGWEIHDGAFLERSAGPTESFAGALFVVGVDGDQAFRFTVTGTESAVTAELEPDLIPLRRFGGKAVVRAGDRVYYDFEQRWLPLTARLRRRFVTEGRIVSGPMDSEIAECRWHRLFIDGCIPPDTAVRVETRTADHADRLSDQPWQPEPELYRRDGGSELPYHRPFTDSERERPGTGTWELLLQRAEGRYLQVRLTLHGSGRASPRLYALRVYRPRFSYLDHYLPDVYRQDEESAHFFERYLANAEGLFTALEGRIAHARSLFDTRTVPDEYLDWLGSWFDAEFDAALDDRRRRLVLDHAVELYDQRGTPRGLARMLTVALDTCADDALFTPGGVAAAIGRPEDADRQTRRQFGVRIVEQFAARDVPRASVGDATAAGQPTEVPVDSPWRPEDGAEVLHRRFERFLSDRYETESERLENWPEPRFPPLLPSSRSSEGPRRRADWRTFVRRVVEGPYAEIEAAPEEGGGSATSDAVTARFRAFLRRRYGRVEDLSSGWPDHPGTLEEMDLPGELPTGDALGDWMDFVGLSLPIERAAHRFRVLVPVEPEEPVDVQRDRLEIARRVARKQKPVHTDVEVLPYWAAFRVGTGRTGLDTVLGAGSRYSDLLVGRDALGDHTVGAAHPEDVTDRRIAGRDAPDAPRPL